MCDKEDKDMIAITLDEIEARVKINSDTKEKAIRDYQKNIQGKMLEKDRVRPKDPDEERILASFKRK